MTIGFDIPWPAKRSQSPREYQTSGPQIGVPERSGEHAKPVFINTGVKTSIPARARDRPPTGLEPQHGSGHLRQGGDPTDVEEKHLCALGPAVSAYLDFALQTKGLQRHEFIRRLLTLSRTMSVELSAKTVKRARKCRIISLETLARIALLHLQQGPG